MSTTLPSPSTSHIIKTKIDESETEYNNNIKHLIDSSVLSPQRYIFWMNDISILWKNGAYLKFVPTSDMTRVEQLNALTRFCLYLIIFLLLFDRTDEFIYVPIIGII